MNVKTSCFEAGLLQAPRFILPLAALLGILLSACDTPSGVQQVVNPSVEDKVVNPPVEDIIATLEDEVQDLPGKRIAWSTYWKLCWQSYPAAKAYELQTLTGEGVSPKLRRQSDRCFRIQAAANENQKSLGLFNRKVMLLLQKGQLAYRVRAVLNEKLVSEWSPAMAVGEATRCLSNCKRHTAASK